MIASRFFALCAVAVGVALVPAAPSALAQERAGAPGAQRISGERMARAGLTRADDLFWLMDGWAAASLDGYATRPSAVGMPDAPLVIAGGQPFTDGALGAPALAMLPMHLQQVRAVEASRAPQLVAGRLAPNGAVRLRLRRPEPGAHAQGAFSVGNEVGDPGPFRSTGRSVPNVDRIGPQYFAEASFREPASSVRLSLRAVRHYTTDATIRARVATANNPSDGPPLQQLIAPRLTLRSAGGMIPGTFRLTTHYATLRALPFFRTLGYEVPARRRHARATVQGEVPLQPGLPLQPDRAARRSSRVTYRLGYRRAALASDVDRFRTDTLDVLNFGWTEDHVSGQVEAKRLSLGVNPGDPARLRVGLSGDYRHAHVASGAPLHDPDVLTTRAYAKLSVPSARFRPQFALLLSQTDGRLGGGALLSSRLSLGEGSSAELRLGYVRRPYAARSSLWYGGLKQGLPVPQAPGGRVALPSSFSSSGRFTADLRLRHAFAEGPRLTLEMGARRFRGLTLPDADYGFVPVPAGPDVVSPGGRLVPDLRLHTDAAGQTLYASVEGRYDFPAGLTHRLRYDFFAYRAEGRGSRREAFLQRFRRTPRHRVRYSARLAVGDRFSLEGRATMHSPERWPAYHRAAETHESPYRDRLPTRLRVDAAATKRLWRNHLRLRLSLRNLLDAPLRTHPAGPVRRLALFASIEAQF